MSSPVGDHDEDIEAYEGEEHSPEKQQSSASRHKQRFSIDDDEDDDDEEDEEDEEEEGDGARGSRKRQKRRKIANRFLDVEAEVDDDDEDLDEDDEELVKESRDFIAEDETLDTEDGMRRITADHQRFARREREISDLDAAQIAQNIKERYVRPASRYLGDGEVPQRLLMPSVNDPFLWQVRVKPGRERDLVFSIMRKFMDLEFSQRSLDIMSAFQRDSLPGMIYVEARNEQHVLQAVNGLVGVYPSRGITLVPIDEMASLLRIKKQQTVIAPGSWVRIKRGKYAGDLAQVLDVTDNGEEAGLKLIPRIDLNPQEGDNRKRKKTTTGQPLAFRPPQRFFNVEEVTKVYGNKSCVRRGGKYVFNQETYSYGYLEKDIRISGLTTENVNPTLDEITRFSAGDGENGEGSSNVDLSVIADAARKAATVVLQPGDHVEVFEGEQTGVHGIVESIRDDIVIFRAKHVDIEGQRIEVPASSVRKRFKPGDHVKVMAGKNADETGLVVSVVNNVVTIWSDISNQEVTVFSKDVREAAEVGASTNIVGEYELHDLVQLDQQTVGVIFKTERITFRVLDQNGIVRVVQPHQITTRKESKRAIATDSQGHPLRITDNVKEVDGAGRRGIVLHIHQSHYAFLHNREIAENGGVFVVGARSLVSVAPKSMAGRPVGPDLSKMNPALAGGATGGMVGSGNMGRGPRDKLIGTPIVVVKGDFKGYLGTIKDTNGQMIRVELHTGNKIITVDKDKLRRKNANGQIEALESAGHGMGPPSATPRGGFSSRRTPNPYANGGSQTPGWGTNSGRTPNPYADGGRTPAWAASSRTPNPYADGNKTPAWNASSRTPNPYADGGRTPAWNASSRTPNPYASGSGTGGGRTPATGANAGGKTPGGGWGSATPSRGGASGSSSGWGGATPAPGASSAPGGGWDTAPVPTNDWGSDAWDTSPTPISAPTPYIASAPTPYGAPTPAAGRDSDDWGGPSTAPTPYGAPTPFVANTPYGAPTPGFAGAPTPGFSNAAYAAQTPHGAPTPFVGASSDRWASEGSREFVLSREWALGLTNVWVDVKSNGIWHGGTYDRRQVVVLSTLDTGAHFTKTATIKFMDGEEKNTERGGVPIEYLKPVYPDKTSTEGKAVPLDGRFKHILVNYFGEFDPNQGWLTERADELEETQVAYLDTRMVKAYEWRPEMGS